MSSGWIDWRKDGMLTSRSDRLAQLSVPFRPWWRLFAGAQLRKEEVVEEREEEEEEGEEEGEGEEREEGEREGESERESA